MNCSWVTFVAIPHGLLAPHVSLQKSYGNMVFPCDGLFAFYAGCFKKIFLLPLDWDIVHSCFAPFFHLTWIALFKHSGFFQLSVSDFFTLFLYLRPECFPFLGYGLRAECFEVFCFSLEGKLEEVQMPGTFFFGLWGYIFSSDILLSILHQVYKPGKRGTGYLTLHSVLFVCVFVGEKGASHPIGKHPQTLVSFLNSFQSTGWIYPFKETHSLPFS